MSREYSHGHIVGRWPRRTWRQGRRQRRQRRQRRWQGRSRYIDLLFFRHMILGSLERGLHDTHHVHGPQPKQFALNEPKNEPKKVIHCWYSSHGLSLSLSLSLFLSLFLFHHTHTHTHTHIIWEHCLPGMKASGCMCTRMYTHRTI
jgi:hypothetical protein